MRLEIRRRGVNVTEALRDHLNGRLGRALNHFGRHIGLVRVYLRDVNGPRGGLATTCRIVVELSSGGCVIASDTDTDIGAAITGTANRAGVAMKRHIKRRRARRRPSRRPDSTGGVEQLPLTGSNHLSRRHRQPSVRATTKA